MTQIANDRKRYRSFYTSRKIDDLIMQDLVKNRPVVAKQPTIFAFLTPKRRGGLEQLLSNSDVAAGIGFADLTGNGRMKVGNRYQVSPRIGDRV